MSMLFHFKKKYVKLRVNEESIKMLSNDIAEMNFIPKRTEDENDVYNWLVSLKFKAEAILEHGFELKKL